VSRETWVCNRPHYRYNRYRWRALRLEGVRSCSREETMNHYVLHKPNRDHMPEIFASQEDFVPIQEGARPFRAPHRPRGSRHCRRAGTAGSRDGNSTCRIVVAAAKTRRGRLFDHRPWRRLDHPPGSTDRAESSSASIRLRCRACRASPTRSAGTCPARSTTRPRRQTAAPWESSRHTWWG
jgi:hypothetical protein